MTIHLSIVTTDGLIFTSTHKTEDLRAVHAACRKQFGPAKGVVIAQFDALWWRFRDAKVRVTGEGVREIHGFRRR